MVKICFSTKKKTKTKQNNPNSLIQKIVIFDGGLGRGVGGNVFSRVKEKVFDEDPRVHVILGFQPNFTFDDFSESFLKISFPSLWLAAPGQQRTYSSQFRQSQSNQELYAIAVTTPSGTTPEKN